MNVERAVQWVTELTVRSLDPDAVILFGSVAQGRPRADSDIDLLVIGRFREPRRLRALQLRGLLEQAALPVDLHVYTQEEVAVECMNPHSLVSTALAKGQPLHVRRRALSRNL